MFIIVFKCDSLLFERYYYFKSARPLNQNLERRKEGGKREGKREREREREKE